MAKNGSKNSGWSRAKGRVGKTFKLIRFLKRLGHKADRRRWKDTHERARRVTDYDVD